MEQMMLGLVVVGVGHIGSELPKVLFWALLLVKALFSHFFGSGGWLGEGVG